MNDDKFDRTLPFKTKCGLPARLLGVLNSTSETPLTVAVTLDGEENCCHYTLEGVFTGPSDGLQLDLVNCTNEEWNALKSTDFVHAVVTKELDPIPRDSNPFHYDSFSMGSDLIRGWMVMHEGYDSNEAQRPLRSLTLINTRSGQRIVVDLSTPKAVQPVFKRVYYGQPLGSDTEWVRFDGVPEDSVLAGLKKWRDTLGLVALQGLSEKEGFSDKAVAYYSHDNLAVFTEFLEQS